MIGIIGKISLSGGSNSGQVIRTTIFYETLVHHYGKDNVYCANIRAYKEHLISSTLSVIKCIIKCDKIIVMVHDNGRKFFFPLMNVLKKVFKKKIYHNVIGGNFYEFLENNPRLIKHVTNFDVNWVQMKSQITNLETLGLQNCVLLPNTKNVKILNEEEIEEYSDSIYRFCTFSRISEAKGIELAINAIEKINATTGKTVAILDIYGVPDKDYAERFENVIKASSKAISYKGLVAADKSVETLKGYYMLLFPSTYYSEGFPGTVWDAFAAGVPIIATNWHFNADIITNGKTGLIYDYNNSNGLFECISYAMNNRQTINSMRVNCLADLEQYRPDKVFPIVFQALDKR